MLGRPTHFKLASSRVLWGSRFSCCGIMVNLALFSSVELYSVRRLLQCTWRSEEAPICKSTSAMVYLFRLIRKIIYSRASARNVVGRYFIYMYLYIYIRPSQTLGLSSCSLFIRSGWNRWVRKKRSVQPIRLSTGRGITHAMSRCPCQKGGQNDKPGEANKNLLG